MWYFVVIGYVAPLSDFDVGFPLLAQHFLGCLSLCCPGICVACDASASWLACVTHWQLSV